ncbi:uncharacterized protein YPO0396 [Variovorax boronicumulans]|uniref:ATP-binding protein n=1 Tax=Variovorax boronicumulans TaxID=436515 RepID=UPI00278BACBB|nr:SbcC/MukB-like Walker B domain-containing protein [Variovorax boronicumulans]MDP9994432.1 uncharacterized protein YPO0396 [Variovorax boronicumulans]MDQ0005869.1 uncharacterized protein YPO0396 [Variovorax boronicumulans]MDQ0044492.1 uncharacterized protein YPO0396 [Variovorax boronicumulans]
MSTNDHPTGAMPETSHAAILHVPAFLLKRPAVQALAIKESAANGQPSPDPFPDFGEAPEASPESARDSAVPVDEAGNDLFLERPAIDQDHPDVQAQFRLRRLQAFNWGTFQGVADFPIAPEGYLFVGNSGSGKSTMLDGLAALTTPAASRIFNAAAREADRGRSDRNLVTYVRGAWARQSNDEREAVQQFLRKGTTWSALAATYRNANGAIVTIVLLMWIRGNSTSVRDLRQQYFVFEREFDVKEFKTPFADTDFDLRKLKAAFPGVFVKDEFKAYQERFCRLLGIENERALRLLHKTQSTKDLGELNVFLRDFMLDEPETLSIADRLVKDFKELNDAHAEVVSARKQIETLKPARANFISRALHVTQIDELHAIDEHLESYAQEQRRDLLGSEIDMTRREIQHIQIDIQEAKTTEAHAKDLRDQYISQVQGAGGVLLQNLEIRIQEAEAQQGSRLAKRAVVDAACQSLDWVTPNAPQTFLATVEKARAMLVGSSSADDLERRRDPIKREYDEKLGRLSDLRSEIASMELQPSSIPAPYLRLRAELAQELGAQPSELPFAGELMEVRPEDAEWTGAIERVLHGFSLSIVVQPELYADFSRALNERHTGMRIVYLRAMVASPNEADRRTLAEGSLIRKVNLARGPHQNWMRQQLRQHFDYECVEDMAEFRSSPRAVTKKGQVKHNSTRHEKDDRFDVRDRHRWVMGLDNLAKRQHFIEEAQTVSVELAALQGKLNGLNKERDDQLLRRDKANVLVNVSWDEMDVRGLLGQIAGLQRQRLLELERNPNLDKLREQLASQEKHYNAAVGKRQQAEAQEREKLNSLTNLQKRLDSLIVAHVLTDSMRAAIKERFSRVARPMTLESLDGIVSTVIRGIATERDEHKSKSATLQAAIEQTFRDYSRIWPSEAGGLDPKLESSTDFIAILERLETDDLPRFEDRFMQLLQQQSNQNLATMQQRLDFERKQIHDRLDQVNGSLQTADYNPGTHLVIEPHDRTLDEVKSFRVQLRDALTQAFTQDKEAAERRFEALSAMVKRLSSQESADIKWRTLVLDVRLHVDFRVRELGRDGIEREVYHSGAGKSGGQRQKLAAACLAAALRYQLGGQDRKVPSYSTVVLDEAFDKADAEFTAAAMTIFKTFGFQMVVATPMRSVMTLEPFIGGASVIHIVDGKSSRFSQVQYDNTHRRLGLTTELHSLANDD